MKSKMMSAILMSNNISNLMKRISIATSPFAIKLFGSYGAGIAAGILTLLILVFGEITPKRCGASVLQRFTQRCASYMDTDGGFYTTDHNYQFPYNLHI